MGTDPERKYLDIKLTDKGEIIKFLDIKFINFCLWGFNNDSDMFMIIASYYYFFFFLITKEM